MIAPRAVRIALLALAVFPQAALAHKVNVFAWEEEGKVAVEGYFTDGAPSRRSEIVVSAPDGTTVAKGITDDGGRFAFSPSVRGVDLTVSLVEPAGHRAEITLKADEYGFSAPSKTSPPPDASPSGEPTAPPEEPPEDANESAVEIRVTERPGGGAAGEVELRAIVREEIDAALTKQLAPIRRRLAESERKKNDLASAAGAAGYFVGALGLWLWWKYGKTKGRGDGV